MSFFEALKSRGVDLFTGVPDSLLKNFCFYLKDHGQTDSHIITANEGNAIALAAGYHLSTGKIGAVYLQNSGIGNTINPLVSLTDPDVYRIPLLMIIGWRGEPGIKDEPQHIKQGSITLQQLKLLDIPYWILDSSSDLDIVLTDVFLSIHDSGSPAAVVIRKDTFMDYNSTLTIQPISELQRENALRKLLDLIHSKDIIVSTTGKTSRELFELRFKRGDSQRDFFTVGSMGHTSSIALGVALGIPKRRVICLDGDGSMLMHLGAVPIIGNVKPSNFIHILLNNGAHESVGGQPTVANEIDFEAIALACGYRHYHQANDQNSIENCWHVIEAQQGPIFFEIKTCIGSREDLGRPSFSPEQNKHFFIEHARD